MSCLEALILGVVQGLTEFLPVSSSGHLQIGHALFGTGGEENLTFAVAVHAGTVLSTIFVFRKEIWQLLKGIFGTVTWNTEKDYAGKLLLSMVPVFVVGVFFKEQVEAYFNSGLIVVGICLILTAILLAVSEYITKHRTSEGHEVTYRDAFNIGCAQALAVLPGLSRSGTTIATGLLLGVKKESVAQFSFLMVLIPIIGEAFLDLLDYVQEPAAVAAISPLSLGTGFLAAFLTGCFACLFMVNIVKKQKLTYFAVYCMLAGTIALIYSLI